MCDTMIKTILMSCRNQTILATCHVSLICLALFSFSADAYSDSIILDMEPEVIYGNDIKIAGTISFAEIKFNQGIPVSMELRDDTGNIIDARSTTPKEDGSFYYAVSNDRIKEFDGKEKRFTVTVYYGSPNPSLLNTQYSTTYSFKVVKPSENNPIQNPSQETSVNLESKQNTVSDMDDNLEISNYSNVLIVIPVVVFVVIIAVIKIVRSQRMWKKAEILANKASKHSMEKTNVLENYIR